MRELGREVPDGAGAKGRSRSEVFQKLGVHDAFTAYSMRRPGIVPVESKESFYVQAADIAAEIASHIMAQVAWWVDP
jgi:hypothetical protein